MTPCGGDLERTLGAFLSLHVAKVKPSRAGGGKARLRRRQELGSLEMVDDGQQIWRGNDLDLASPGCLATARGRADDAAAPGCRGQCREQHPGNIRQGAVKG